MLSTISVVKCQYVKTSANSNAIGWRKVAYIDSNNKRGFGKVTIYIPGGDNEPLYADIYWYSNWADTYVLRTETLTTHWPYWEAQLLRTIANSGIPNPGGQIHFVDGNRGGIIRNREIIMSNHYAIGATDRFNGG